MPEVSISPGGSSSKAAERDVREVAALAHQGGQDRLAQHRGARAVRRKRSRGSKW